MKEEWVACEYFNHLARKYDHYRTLDEAPVHYLINNVPGSDQTICDLGCGTGRYLIKIIKAFQESGVRINDAYGVDISPAMLETAKLHADGLNNPVSWILATSDRTGLSEQSISLVTAFNSFHHLPVAETLTEVARILSPGAFLAIYTRTREQEAEHIWGRWFPGYLDYSQVPTRIIMRGLSRYNKRFRLTQVKDFTFMRRVPFSWVCEQTENRYYSTLDRYPPGEFESSYAVFLENIKVNCQHLDEIMYNSSYSLFLYQLES